MAPNTSTYPAEQPDVMKRVIDLSRLALTGSRRDVELSIRRLARSLQKTDSTVAHQLTDLLASSPDVSTPFRDLSPQHIPLDGESRLRLLRYSPVAEIDEVPILDNPIQRVLDRILREHGRRDALLRKGIDASRKLLFFGPPGVGKTMSARWLASRLGLPILVVDLSVVMNSFLGKTGANIRSVFDYAKGTPCVLLLDEIDSLAKKRDDAADVGELKRLVTVLIQELDDWGAVGVIIAATNHPGLLDPAIWRRFDQIVEFSLPSLEVRNELLARLLADVDDIGREDVTVLSVSTEGMVHGEIVREVESIIREAIVYEEATGQVLRRRIADIIAQFPGDKRRSTATSLAAHGLAQREVHRLTGVSRDTLRRRTKDQG